MSIRMLVILVMLICPVVSQATSIYRSTDAQGNVIFSDQPRQGGERIELNPLTVIPTRQPELRPAPAQLQAPAASRQGAVSAPFMPYSSFRIVTPRNEETLQTGHAGNVQVQVGIEPALRDDHQIRLLVNDQVSQSALHSDVFMLTNLDRGEHILEAELLDGRGQVRHRSAPVTLYVQRASVNLPQNPNNPNNPN
ncbi:MULTISPECIES: DUF4124 domain-containing protein [Halomonadaceae]|uniref:DUF4124 domain-containing protein n=1 Tax=Halomonadaceae TaxID=28256 RepID=UPI00159B2584|nr:MULTISPECIES: DUF4124 domain-containing protein [Halomonas]QJQ94164.1 DUF4124 domain-containing protein [Halomonas sp. PA5]